jgi:phosphomannomutase
LGIAPAKSELETIAQPISRQNSSPNIIGTIEERDLLSAYCQTIALQFDLEMIGNRFPAVAVDSMHGTTSGLLRRIVAKHFSVIGVRENPDPLFGGQSPEPKPTTLSPLSRALLKHHCPIGIANDGDGDRLAIWDSKLGFVSPQEILTFLTWDILNQGVPGSIVTSITTTSQVERMALQRNRSYYRFDVGFNNASQLMLKHDIALAGEENGGVAFGNHIPDRDGTYAALKVLSLLARNNLTLQNLKSEIAVKFGPSCYIRKDISIATISNFKFASIVDILETKFLNAQFSHFKNGIKIIISPTSWVAIRCAATEPLLRIYCETSSQPESRKIIETIARCIK